MTLITDIQGLDEGIKEAVAILIDAGVETFESCEGGPGHAFSDPTIRFEGVSSEGYRVLTIAVQNGLKVRELRRTWSYNDCELVGPFWELVLYPEKVAGDMGYTLPDIEEHTL